MSFFKNKYPDNSQWLKIATEIAEGFEATGKAWFDNFKETTIFIRNNANDLDDAEIASALDNIDLLNEKLAGNAQIAIKAMQIYYAIGFIAPNDYIAKHQRKSFTDLLISQVCGNQIRECLEYLQNIPEIDEERYIQFTESIFNHVIGRNYINEYPQLFSVLVGLTRNIPELLTYSTMIVAYCFGDDLQANTILKRWKDGQ